MFIGAGSLFGGAGLLIVEESSHLCVLANMLATLKSEPTLLSHFMEYMIAASHPKIKRHLKAPSSWEYLHCFMLTKPEEIDFSSASSHSQRERVQNKLQNNVKLLNLLQKCKAVPDYETKHPNIAIVKNTHHFAITSNSKFFNATMHKEYHVLFIHLMTQYKEKVDVIDAKPRA